ncbi:chondroitin synthase [bacterium BMS3Abin01]|nr:chondroitin synthase [bacterium BMS3Abin01]
MLERIRGRFSHGGNQDRVYQKWLAENENRESSQVTKDIQGYELKPKISLIVTVFNTDPGSLNRCIESVRRQVYDNWELCLHDNASSRQETIDCLDRWGRQDDPRIIVALGEQNEDKSIRSNEAVRMAGGEYIGILGDNDELSPFALSEVVGLINERPGADLIYSDEDRIDAAGNRFDPWFKPDWSPELLMSVNYINRFYVVRREIGDRVGWYRPGYDGAQDYDLLLRIYLVSDKFFHIPRILYHSGTASRPARSTVAEKDNSSDDGLKAVTDFLDARGEQATAAAGAISTEYIVRYKVRGSPKVSIIVPFKDKVELLKNCIDRLLEKSSYPDYEVILISNNSREGETREYLESLNHPRVRLFTYDIPFNYSKINNWGAAQATGEYLLFLNNDTEVISPSWIEEMLGYAQRPEIGAVGAKLLFEDGTIQHGGVVLGIGGFADHIYAGARENSSTAFGRDTWTRNYLAVTAACLMVDRKKFEAVGGFDEEFVVCGSDVELCLRLYAAGYRNVYLAFVRLYHYEAQTRRAWVDQKDIECSIRHYAPFLQRGDPYYNENLSLAGTDGNTLRGLREN